MEIFVFSVLKYHDLDLLALKCTFQGTISAYCLVKDKLAVQLLRMSCSP